MIKQALGVWDKRTNDGLNKENIYNIPRQVTARQRHRLYLHSHGDEKYIWVYDYETMETLIEKKLEKALIVNKNKRTKKRRMVLQVTKHGYVMKTAICQLFKHVHIR